MIYCNYSLHHFAQATNILIRLRLHDFDSAYDLVKKFYSRIGAETALEMDYVYLRCSYILLSHQ